MNLTSEYTSKLYVLGSRITDSQRRDVREQWAKFQEILEQLKEDNPKGLTNLDYLCELDPRWKPVKEAARVLMDICWTETVRAKRLEKERVDADQG